MKVDTKIREKKESVLEREQKKDENIKSNELLFYKTRNYSYNGIEPSEPTKNLS